MLPDDRQAKSASCGAITPSSVSGPTTATANVFISTASSNSAGRMRAASSPSAMAMSVPSACTASEGPASSRAGRLSATSTSRIDSEAQLAWNRLPAIHSAMATDASPGRYSSSTAATLESTDSMAMPISRMARPLVRVRPTRTTSSSATPTPPSTPPSEVSHAGAVGSSTRSAITAVTAPWLSPSRPGSASGLRAMDCSMAPETATHHPARQASSTRGRRTETTA